MRRLLLLLFLLAPWSCFGAGALVNSVACVGTSLTSCATSWNVTAGNVVVVLAGSPAVANHSFVTSVTDNFGSTYSTVHEENKYWYSSRISVGLLASGGSTLTVTVANGQNRIQIAEFSGVTAALSGTKITATTIGTGVNPATALSITTTADTLLIAGMVWSTGNRTSGCATTGTSALTTLDLATSCPSGGSTGLAYGFRTAGTYTQQWTFTPSFNGGEGVDVLFALQLSGGAPTVKVRHRVVSR